MNQSPTQGDSIEFDFSHGSSNPYTVEARHNLIPRCMVCGKGSIIKLDGSEYFAYFNRGVNIAEAFPTLRPDQREVMMTGTHPQCWDELFAEDCEEDDD